MAPWIRGWQGWLRRNRVIARWIRGWQGWLLLVAVAAALLVVVNIVFFEMNRRLQTEVSGRARYIQQTVQLETLTRELVTAIANLAARNNDDALRGLLAQHGVTVNAPAAVPAPPPPAPRTPSR